MRRIQGGMARKYSGKCILLVMNFNDEKAKMNGNKVDLSKRVDLVLFGKLC